MKGDELEICEVAMRLVRFVLGNEEMFTLMSDMALKKFYLWYNFPCHFKIMLLAHPKET